jgi:hypothetical protein
MRDQQTIDAYTRFFRGNSDAVAFAMMLIHVADIWDDLVDGDQQITNGDLHKAFWFCLSGIPRNQFYREFHTELMPIMEVAIFNWLASDKLVASGDAKSLEVANVIRHSLSDVFVHMARLIGGFEWAAQVTPEIKMLAQNDTLEDFVKG